MAQTYYLVVYLASATDPADDATGHGQIKDGKDGDGATAVFAGSTTWAGSGTYIDITGLSAGTLYGWAAVVYDDVALTYSNRVLGTETLTAIAVPAAAIQRQALTPTVVATDNKFVAVPVASKQSQAHAPSVSTSSGQVVLVPTAARQLTGYAPTVGTTGLVSVPSAAKEISAYAPTVSVSADRVVQVPAATLQRTALAPTVATTATIAVPVASKQWHAYAPTVSDGSAPPVVEPTQTPAGSNKKRRRQRHIVEIDDKVIEVESIDQALDILAEAKQKAMDAAALAVSRATKRKATPKRDIIRDAAKSLKVPKVTTSSPDLAEAVRSWVDDVTREYSDAMRSVEISALLMAAERAIEEDDELVMMLL